jgi:hypothetical protein
MHTLRRAADGRLSGKREAGDDGGDRAQKRRQLRAPTGRRVRTVSASCHVGARPPMLMCLYRRWRVRAGCFWRRTWRALM